MGMRLSDLWIWDGTIGRAAYAVWGALLFAIKHNIDRFIATFIFDRRWGIFNYFNPSDYFNVASIPREQRAFYGTLLAVAVPFIFVGVILTLRRLRAVRLPLWLVILFFVPVVNFLLFLLLSILPSRRPTEPYEQIPAKVKVQAWFDRLIPERPVASAAFSLVVTIPFAVWVTLFSVSGLGNYGWGLFVGLPFALGLTSVLIYSYHGPRGLGSSLAVSMLSVIVSGLALLAFAIEGAVCLMMAAPIGFVIAVFGGFIGYLIANKGSLRSEAPILYCVLAVASPGLIALEHAGTGEPQLIEVRSAIEVNAPPDQVWPHVISFSKLPPPTELLFRTGIAYPVKAELEGQGPGAVRRCIFSTGVFVEPIQVWEAPHLLRFGVIEQAPPMHEISPYGRIRPPHLNNYLTSQAGQFLLTPLPDGRTRLEGTTWYRNYFWPAAYWRLWSDAIIHRIHLRVLNHIKQISERSLAGYPTADSISNETRLSSSKPVDETPFKIARSALRSAARCRADRDLTWVGYRLEASIQSDRAGGACGPHRGGS
jgi:uncharacterized membrane protein YhaH (DUF805 family)